MRKDWYENDFGWVLRVTLTDEQEGELGFHGEWFYVQGDGQEPWDGSAGSFYRTVIEDGRWVRHMGGPMFGTDTRREPVDG